MSHPSTAPRYKRCTMGCGNDMRGEWVKLEGAKGVWLYLCPQCDRTR